MSVLVRSRWTRRPARLKVPDQSIAILKALLARPGGLVTREELRARLWPSDTFVDFEHGLNAAVRRLRESLGDSADTPQFIETLPRRGYRFVGTVEGAAPVLPAAEPPAGRRIPWHLMLAGAAIAVIAGIGLWFGLRERSAASSLERTDTRAIPVTTLVGREVGPHISPDGNHVAFAWDRDVSGGFDIYVKLIDGGTPVPVTRDPAPEFSPAWSPDGHRLAFLRARGRAARRLARPSGT